MDLSCLNMNALSMPNKLTRHGAGTKGEAVSVDLQTSDSAPGKHESVLMQWSGYSQEAGAGMKLLSVQ